MIRLPKTINSWDTPQFNDIFKSEIEMLGPYQLPLQQGLTQGSSVGASKFSVMFISETEEVDARYVKAGIFYKSVIAGCNCADDPTPVDEQNEYCEVQFKINRETAEATVKLLS